jgi:hypothetical protein
VFPWTWSWAPQVHLPLSGNIAQRIEPITHQFFQGIDSAAGNARIEERAFSVATYGTQLGLITDVLIDLAERSGDRPSSSAASALDKLKQVRDQIEAVKADEYAALCGELEARLATLQRKGGARFAQLAERQRPLLGAPAA